MSIFNKTTPLHISPNLQNPYGRAWSSRFLFHWPASSQDMNPIEEIWRRMKSRISHRNPRPTRVLVELQAAIQEEWDAITQDEIQALVSTMPQRIAAPLEASGGHTKF